jgi:HPt (histidine-containing phosphotransfer) domain-containing protein
VGALARVVDEPPQPSPAADGRAIDAEHLSRMTLGEPSLEREVLALFERQAEILLPRIRSGARTGGGHGAASGLAHTLKGSASSIGAFRVAKAAAAVEQASGEGLAAAIDDLSAALAETSAEIARLLRVR